MSSPEPDNRVVLPEIDDAKKDSSAFDKSPQTAPKGKVQPEDLEAAGSI